MSLHSEILEQPVCLDNLLDSQRSTVERIAVEFHKQSINYVFLAARGTSDNAGRYANYLWGAKNQLPLALATPSLFTYYKNPPSLKGAMVVGISQSGQSPDIIQVIEEGNRQGCLTLAITNSPESPLAKVARLVFDIQAGEELAVAATKTYTAELLAIAMISVALAGDTKSWEDLSKINKWSRDVINLESLISSQAERYTFMQQCIVLGRGFNYCTAFEWALKLKELSYLVAEPYSTADFLHGPIAIVEKGFPILAVATHGKVFESILEMLATMRGSQHADLVIISEDKRALSIAQSPIHLPKGIPEWLSPILTIIPAQLFSYHLTRAKGLDTEKPRTIGKITETR
jgi:glucosamine--fructose-6-phosphate aminotransferase (isomerizing)